MDLLSDTRCLYHLGHHRDVSRKTVLYDSRIGNRWRVSARIFGVTYALREPEIFTARDTSTLMETDWTRVVRGLLFDLRNDHRLSKSACAVYFPDFWVEP